MVRSIFGTLKNKTSTYLDELKVKREREAEQLKFEQTEERKAQGKYFSEESKQKAIQHTKDKAASIINNPSAPLSKKIAALNEYYKDHTKPKATNAMQDMSDRAYLNRYRRDMKLEKLSLLKQAIKQDKINKQIEKAERMQQLKIRNQFLKDQRDAKKQMQREKLDRFKLNRRL